MYENTSNDNLIQALRSEIHDLKLKDDYSSHRRKNTYRGIVRMSEIRVDENGELTDELETQLLAMLHKHIIPSLHEIEGEALTKLAG